jgi:hypothetical protein
MSFPTLLRLRRSEFEIKTYGQDTFDLYSLTTFKPLFNVTLSLPTKYNRMPPLLIWTTKHEIESKEPLERSSCFSIAIQEGIGWDPSMFSPLYVCEVFLALPLLFQERMWKKPWSYPSLEVVILFLILKFKPHHTYHSTVKSLQMDQWGKTLKEDLQAIRQAESSLSYKV